MIIRKILFLVFFVIFIFPLNTVLALDRLPTIRTKVVLPPLATNSPYKNGINDACGGCVSPMVCVGTTCGSSCGTPPTACEANQVCNSGSCVSDITSCFDGSSYTTCVNGETCGGNVILPYQGSTELRGLCTCSNGILNDNNNCGTCGSACTGPTAYCSFGQCINANLCGIGGCTGSNCANVSSIGTLCSDGNLYVGGNLEMSPSDITPMMWVDAKSYCALLGSGWSLPTQEIGRAHV